MQANLNDPVFMRSINDNSVIQQIPAPAALRNGNINDVSIVKNAFITSKGPFAVCKLNGIPVLIAESANYGDLFGRYAPKEISVDSMDKAERIYEGEFALLANIWSDNLYHWFEELFRVLILEEAGFSGKYIVHGGRRFIPESLAELGILTDRIVIFDGMEARIEKLWITSRTSIPHDLVSRSDLFWRLRSRMSGQSGHGRDKKVFLIRNQEVYNPRDIENKEEIIRISEQYDFQAVDPASLPFSEQVALIASCRSIMGMHGAAFCHSMFMPRAASVLEIFSPQYINYSCFPIYELMQHRYVPLVPHVDGPYKFGENAYVPPRILKLILGNTLK